MTLAPRRLRQVALLSLAAFSAIPLLAQTDPLPSWNRGAKRECACGRAAGLRETKVGTLTQALYNEAKSKGWTVISMKTDWKRIFAFEE